MWIAFYFQSDGAGLSTLSSPCVDLVAVSFLELVLIAQMLTYSAHVGRPSVNGNFLLPTPSRFCAIALPIISRVTPDSTFLFLMPKGMFLMLATKDGVPRQHCPTPSTETGRASSWPVGSWQPALTELTINANE